jgi:hypothetical protein
VEYNKRKEDEKLIITTRDIDFDGSFGLFNV